MAGQRTRPLQKPLNNGPSLPKPQQRGRPGFQNHRRESHFDHFDPDVAARESQSLRDALHERGCHPGQQDEDDQSRQVALRTLERILCQWASSVQASRPNALGDSKWQRPRVSLVTFGSYRLGVHRLESDLDVLALSPPSCTRGDFFTTLVKALREHPGVEDVHAIPSAYTPVIKFQLSGLQIDMLFGRVESASKMLEFQQKSPSPLLSQTLGTKRDEARREYPIDDSDLVGTDEAGVRSLNGVRVTQLILEAVKPNTDAFRITLCAVKEWAIINGLYSNVLGFLGGVNFAILVAWVCKRHPDKKPATLLRVFFRSFAMWKWPNPVLLCPVQTETPRGVPPGMAIWDPESNPRDTRQLMPILTPAYPTMNSAYNVGVPQLRRLQEEMIRMARILEEGEANWPRIFKPSDFFRRHSNFIQVSIRANSADTFLPWQRFCESRLRLLITALETHEVSAWPFARLYGQKYTKFGIIQSGLKTSDDSCRHESFFFIALRFAPGVENVDLRYSTSDFLYKMNTWEERKEGMDLGVCHLTQKELPSFVFDQSPAKKSEAEASHNIAKEHSNGVGQDQTDENKNSTRLTPKLARSTLSDNDLGLQSPLKKRKGEQRDL